MTGSVRFLVVAVLVAASCLLASCGGDKATKVASEEAREGRDRALLEQGITAMQKGKYTQARLLFNTLINTYPDSPLLPVTKLAVADCYYRKGGFSDMNESEVEYREWLQFFPRHDLADDVVMKIAEVHMRQVQAADRDTTHAERAERELIKLLKEYPQTDLKDRAEAQLWEVREILGMHELKVARFYFTHRQAYKAASERAKGIVNKYPGFSRTDEALYLLAVSMVEQEDSEQAIEHFTRLCRYYPTSDYYEDAVNWLKRLEAEVPEPAPDGERPTPRGKTPGMVTRVFEAISHPRLDNVSKDGVLFKKSDTPVEALQRALKFSTEQASGASTPESVRSESR